MDERSSSPEPQSSLDEILKEVKKEALGRQDISESSQKPTSEIENLKKVLHEADTRAEVVPDHQPLGQSKPADNKALFNENFLKLEQLIRKFKKQS